MTPVETISFLETEDQAEIQTPLSKYLAESFDTVFARAINGGFNRISADGVSYRLNRVGSWQ